MFTLSGASDSVVNWSDFSFLHKTVGKLVKQDLWYIFFKRLQDVSF